MNNPYQTPSADLAVASEQPLYVGFWARAGASLLDTVMLLMVTYPILFAVYGEEYFLGSKEYVFIAGTADALLSYLFPAIAAVLFWTYKSATPGKMAIGAVIVDAKTGGKPSTGQLIGRYFAYYLSLIPLGLGYFWVGWDPKKQGWHDKLAGTVVVRRSGK